MGILIDDFSTGPDSFTVITGEKDALQSGNMIIGGQRKTRLIGTNNPRLQSAHLDVGFGSLNLSTGVEQLFRLELFYGKGADASSPMSLNLKSFNGVRCRFFFIYSGLNFNFQVFSGTKVSTAGVNLDANSTPFTQEFLLPEFEGNADFSAIDLIVLVFQSGPLSGGQYYAIDSIEVT